jgi:low temperature requirement protein LtrA
MGSYAISATVYAILTAVFPRDVPAGELVRTYAYVGFYIVAIAETAVTTAISCYWRIISFKGTHLVQRMSLLTLIILGEGVIGSTKSIAKIVQNDETFSGAVVGQIISAVLIIVSL